MIKMQRRTVTDPGFDETIKNLAPEKIITFSTGQ